MKNDIFDKISPDEALTILKTLADSDKKSSSEFKDWATDIPAEMYGFIVSEWKKRRSTKTDRKEIKTFVRKKLPNWSKWAVNQI